MMPPSCACDRQATYFDADGRRIYRSTKKTQRSDALAAQLEQSARRTASEDNAIRC